MSLRQYPYFVFVLLSILFGVIYSHFIKIMMTAG